MKSVRLSVSIREQMLSQMMKGYCEINKAPISKQEATDQCIAALWQAAFGKIDFSKIPKEFIQTNNRFAATFTGVFVRFDGTKKHPAPDDSYNAAPVKVFEKNPPFYNLYLKQVEVYEEWDKKRKEFKSELESILQSCGTTKQLVNIWPQAVVYLPSGIAESVTRNLPALKTSELNKKLGIK